MNIYISDTNISKIEILVIKEIIKQIGAIIHNDKSTADISISYNDKCNLIISNNHNVREITPTFRAGSIGDEIIKLYSHRKDIKFTFSDIIFHPNNSTIEMKNKEIIRLTDKEKEILITLYHCNNNIMNKEELLKKIWGYDNSINTHTLETHIYRLRQKLEDSEETPTIIKNIDGCYKLII